MKEVVEGFVLTREWRETPRGIALTYWLWTADGPAVVRVLEREDVMFVERDVETRDGRRRPLELTSMRGRPVDGLYFRSRRALVRERDRLAAAYARPLESDVKPDARWLMERFVTGGVAVRGEVHDHDGRFRDVMARDAHAADVTPALRVLSFDVESDGPDGALFSIAATTGTGGDEERVFMIGAGDGEASGADGALRYVPDERALLQAFLAFVREVDPDVLTGWNVIEFDLAKLVARAEACGVPFTLGRADELARVLLPSSPSGVAVARVPGRVVLDGIATMRSATFQLESMSLDNVAKTLLGRGKHVSDEEDRLAEIQRMFAEDKPALAAYNLEDARLALEIVDKARLVGFAVERQRLTGLPMDKQGGSVAAFDFLYLPRLHRHGHVADDVGSASEVVSSPGGFVMDSDPGLYENVLVLDFKSLYPSIIRTFRIDPMGLAFPGDDPIAGFRGATFHRTEHILPALIETLWAARDQAKRDQNRELSTAIKILMNSFYGVLGTPGCRFFDPRLASSITRRGHEIINESRAFIESRGYRVIYGDTDSLFVLVGEGKSERACGAIGDELAAALNAWWKEKLAREHRLESALEIEYETHYLRFLMPTVRHSDKGSKKRYAGSVRNAKTGGVDMVFKGLEAIRTDWTPLARRFQRELYRRIFAGEAWETWARQIIDDLYAGVLDDELVYEKRLRRELDAYEKNVPPHVAAARKLDRPGRSIRYVITTHGPEPVKKRSGAPLDYDHYRDRQLVPAAEAILHFLGKDLLGVAGRQMSLF